MRKITIWVENNMIFWISNEKLSGLMCHSNTFARGGGALRPKLGLYLKRKPVDNWWDRPKGGNSEPRYPSYPHRIPVSSPYPHRMRDTEDTEIHPFLLDPDRIPAISPPYPHIPIVSPSHPRIPAVSGIPGSAVSPLIGPLEKSRCFYVKLSHKVSKRPLEIVNVCHIHEIGLLMIISSFCLPIRSLVMLVFIWLDRVFQALQNGI